MGCLFGITTLEITSPIWNKNEGTAIVKYFYQYRPKDTVAVVYNESVKHILDGGTDILFFNFGLHWGYSSRRVYKGRILATLKTLKQYAMDKISLFVFRETSAQHFNNSGGEHSREAQNKGCVPGYIDKNDSMYGWRERILLDVANETGLTFLQIDPSGKSPMSPTRDKQDEMVLIPFKNFTSELFDLHMGNDCTHYCSTPLLWNPLWRSLRLAMDDRFGAN
jgi:hypothetical protein